MSSIVTPALTVLVAVTTLSSEVNLTKDVISFPKASWAEKMVGTY
jgi:hypothetical protein